MNDTADILGIARCLITQEAKKNETSARKEQIQVSYLIIHIPRLTHLVMMMINHLHCKQLLFLLFLPEFT